MTINNKVYSVGDLFTTQKSGVTGTIKEIVSNEGNRIVVLLDVDGDERYTTVTF